MVSVELDIIKMDKFVAFILFVGVLIAAINNIDAARRVAKKSYKAEAPAPRICSPENFKDLHKCCNLPELLEFAAYNKCMSALETTAKYQMEKTATVKKSASLTDMLKSVFRVDTRKGQRSENLVALPPGSTCVMDCVFKSYNLVGSNGKLDYAAIRERFLKGAESVWLPLINSALDKCFSLISKSSPKPLIKAGEQTCGQDSAAVALCTKRYLVKDCPAEKRTEDAQCKDQVEKLNKCDPLQ